MTFSKKNFAHVHGIIMYSDNKDEADTILENNKKYIDKSLTVEGKYSSKSDVLVLNTQAANKLINEKVFNNVTKKGDKFKFKTVENLSAEPALWTGKEDKTITDDKGQSVKPKSTKYIVLGEYSATSKLLILNDEDYQKFDAKAKFVSVIKEKRDADKVLKSYITSGSIPSQIFPYK
ncbi:lipoprotein BA_5634 family protein [Lactococcus lactis]|uniref:lipoprotein BA_5634 family protein n=1 Tax=Lactococcus lactis TaxID=1358 RepID=UPI0020171099|nr:lipoprotein BA_5634 family protein [Lactococcus lactis]